MNSRCNKCNVFNNGETVFTLYCIDSGLHMKQCTLPSTGTISLLLINWHISILHKVWFK